MLLQPLENEFVDITPEDVLTYLKVEDVLKSIVLVVGRGINESDVLSAINKIDRPTTYKEIVDKLSK